MIIMFSNLATNQNLYFKQKLHIIVSYLKNIADVVILVLMNLIRT